MVEVYFCLVYDVEDVINVVVYVGEEFGYFYS